MDDTMIEMDDTIGLVTTADGRYRFLGAGRVTQPTTASPLLHGTAGAYRN